MSFPRSWVQRAHGNSIFARNSKFNLRISIVTHGYLAQSFHCNIIPHCTFELMGENDSSRRHSLPRWTVQRLGQMYHQHQASRFIGVRNQILKSVIFSSMVIDILSRKTRNIYHQIHKTCKSNYLTDFCLETLALVVRGHIATLIGYTSRPV